MSLLILIIVGAAAGFLATRVMKIEAGLFPTLAVGVLGALVGGVILRLLSSAFGMLSGFAGAVLGAILLLWLWQRFFAKP
jgi:uncharacterized membrane protein YeaQ/YmgE (transglycosylase-associated protein family)